MSDLFKSSRKCYLIDHHSPQPPVIPLNHLDIQEYENFIDTADVDSMMVYCKDHWGVTYYDSQTPGAQKHNGVKGDWIASVSISLSVKKSNLWPITASNMMKVLPECSRNGEYVVRMAVH